jgi:putative endonuclease
MQRQYFVYILANFTNRVLYAGVTNDLSRRVQEHRDKVVPGFTAKYNVHKLVFYDVFDDAITAIEAEKSIKGGSKAKKIKMIEEVNPGWEDLADSIW